MIVIKPEGRIKANRLYDKLYIVSEYNFKPTLLKYRIIRIHYSIQELKPKYYFLNSDDDKTSDPTVNGMKEKSE